MLKSLLDTIWYNQWPTPALIVALIYVGFSVLYPKIKERIEEGSRGERRLRVFLYTLIILLTGYYGRTQANQIQNSTMKIGEVEIPGALFWFVMFGVTLAIAKVVTTLLSMNLYQGLLPDSLNQVEQSQRRYKKLEIEFQVNRLFTIVAADANREASRELLRATRLYEQNDNTFLGLVFNSYLHNVVTQLSAEGIESEYETFTIEDITTGNNPTYKIMSHSEKAALKEVVRRWEKSQAPTENIEIYHVDEQRSETILSVVVHVHGATCVLVISTNQIIPLGSFENLLLLFQRLLNESEIWDYNRVMDEYLQRFGSVEAVETHIISLLNPPNH